MEMGMQSQMINPTVHQSFGMAIFRFFLKLAVLFFLTVDASGGLVYLLYSRHFRWTVLIPTVLAIFCGLMAGLSSRLIFKTFPLIVRWFLSCVAAAVTLAGAGLICRQWLEVDLTGITSALVAPDFFTLSAMACFSAFLVVFSWTKKGIVVQPRGQKSELIPETIQASSSPSSAIPQRGSTSRKGSSSRKRSFSIFPRDVQRRYFRKSGWRRVKKQMRTRWNNFLKFGKRSILSPLRTLFQPGIQTRRTPENPITRLQIQIPEHRTASPTAFPSPLPRKHPTRKAQRTVRLIGKEELRCPYCLQVIDRKDPNGIVVCPICHSAHHKECWDITGSCQVPHNHAML
jgi:hypothetical protein